jgi:hypothetical protein
LANNSIIVAKPGPAASFSNQLVTHDASKRKAPPAKVLQVKKAQANYSSGEGLEKLMATINKWNARTGRALASNGESHGLVQFSNMFGLPFHPFRKYIHPDPEKRQEVGKSAGWPSLFTKGNQGFILNALELVWIELMMDQISLKLLSLFRILTPIFPDLRHVTHSPGPPGQIIPIYSSLSSTTVLLALDIKQLAG